MPGTSTEPVVDKGIRQKSIHSFYSIHSLPDGSAFCPGALRETPACIHVIQRLSQPRVACWHGFRPNSQKNRMRVYTLSDMRSEKNCMYTRPPIANRETCYLAAIVNITFHQSCVFVGSQYIFRWLWGNNRYQFPMPCDFSRAAPLIGSCTNLHV